MRIVLLFFFLLLNTMFSGLFAQGETPRGYIRAKLTVLDGSILHGYIKNNIRYKAAISFIQPETGKKTEYNGNNLIGIEIENISFICINGDFFKILSKGPLCLLQKSSDASSIPVYNGSDPVFSNGTDGRPGDYFFYTENTRELNLISEKIYQKIITQKLGSCPTAFNRATASVNDINGLKEAVDFYNNCK